MSKSELDFIDKLSLDATVDLLQALAKQQPNTVASSSSTSAMNIDADNNLRRKIILGR